MRENTKQGYSVLISILLIGFLLVVTTTVFNLVLKEYNDNRWLWDSIKAYAWAEASQELALLKIKQKWYGIGDKIDHDISTGSIVLAEDITNTGSFLRQKDTFISYDLNVLADFDSTLKYNYSESLSSKWYSIIPLFYEEEWWVWIENVRNYSLNVNNDPSIVWNLISWDVWIWWDGTNTWYWRWKKITAWQAELISSTISSFLPSNNTYLIIFNSWNSSVNIQLTSDDKFSKPKTTILSSAQVGKYRHNLETEYDNTEFLNMLKYAVFSE
jgi:hypothetical protein